MFPVGTDIHAVADGVVIQDAYGFYLGSYALEVNHGSFVVRYGEIAKVGHLDGSKSSMLHFEMYTGKGKGPLTVGAKDSATRKDGVSFRRRTDLVDPAPFLDEWKKNLPSDK